MLATILTAVLLATSGDSRLADRVELNDGSKLEGRVVYEDDQTLVLRVGTRDRELKKSEVKQSVSRAGAQREALERWLALGPVDYRHVLDLASYCKRNDLLEEMNLFALHALLGDPNLADAHEMLGHEKTKGGWLARDGARKVEWEKLLKSHTDFGNPWVLEGTHYKVRTNLPLRDAIAVTLDLECHYIAFRNIFARDLRLLEVVEPMYASVHADAKSFPEIADGRPAYFTSATRTLVVNASARLDVPLLMHEATHGVLYATAMGQSTSRGDIPAWLDEGLAEYVSAGMSGAPGKLTFAGDALFLEHFRTFAQAKSPYDLSRLLNFDSTDYMASSRSDLKYAEAYTLVHFLMKGGGGKYQPKFIDFMKSAYRGQASQTHFKDALGATEAEIERAWKTYVKAIAG